MSDFSSTEAALEGLRLTRERPVALLWWWAAYVVAVLIQFGLGALPGFRSLADQLQALQLQSKLLQQNPDNAATASSFAASLGHVLPLVLVFAACVLLLQMILSTAILRAVLRPAESAFGYLRLSIDELRQFGLALIVLAAFLAYTFAVLIVSAFVLSILGSLIGGAQSPAVLGALSFVILVVAYLYPAVRLSLAPAMTLADGRISFLRAWRLTEGRFWPLLGAYLIAFLLSIALWVAANAVGFIVTMLLGRGQPIMSQTFADLARPAPIAILLLNSLFSALMGATVTAPLASAFRQITGRVGAPPVAKTSTSGSPWGQA